MSVQIISHDSRERLTEQECEVGNFVLAGAEAWRVFPPGKTVRVVRRRIARLGCGAEVFIEMTFERWWTSEDRAIYCWWRVK